MARLYIRSPKSIDQVGSQQQWDDHKLDLGLMALMLWMNENIPPEVNELKDVQDYIISIAFIDRTEKVTTLITTAVFKPESLLRLRKKIQPIDFTKARKNGVLEFTYAFEYLRFL